jgi:hypothetical protein
MTNPTERIVEVEWEDSMARGGWQDPVDEPPESSRTAVRSVGYVKHDSNRGLIIIRSYGPRWSSDVRLEDEQLFIPRSAIRKVTELKLG